MKRLLVMLCVGAMLVTGCGSGGSKTSEPTENHHREISMLNRIFTVYRMSYWMKMKFRLLIYRQMQRESRRFISMQ